MKSAEERLRYVASKMKGCTTKIACCIVSRGLERSFSISNKNSNENNFVRCDMRRKYVLAIGLATSIVVAAVVVLVVAPSRKPAIGIEPESIGRLSINDTFTVNVTVEKCLSIFAVQVDIRYDPQVLNATNIPEGPFLSSTGSSTFLIRNESQLFTTEPSVARIFFADSKQLGTPDPSGGGVLFSITFRVISTGSTQLQIFPVNSDRSQGTYFLTRDLTEIIPDLHSGSYS
jgi:hypothetical protein